MNKMLENRYGVPMSEALEVHVGTSFKLVMEIMKNQIQEEIDSFYDSLDKCAPIEIKKTAKSFRKNSLNDVEWLLDYRYTYLDFFDTKGKLKVN